MLALLSLKGQLMWFSNALIYHYQLDEFDFTQLIEDRLKPCPPHARFIYGWLPPYAEELALETAGSVLICLGKEERILPRSVINKYLAERTEQLETENGRSLKRAEKSQLAEEIEFELLPKSFCVQKRLLAVFDTVKKRLIINSASDTAANQLLSLLRKSLPGIQFTPFSAQGQFALTFSDWIKHPHLVPAGFQLGSDCLLFAAKDEKKRVNCKGYELPADEVLTLLAQGLVVAEISLIWKERIQFTLTHNLSIKRLKCLDYLMDDFNEIKELEEEILQRDAALTLLSGELRALGDDLLTALGDVQEAQKIELIEELA